MEENGYPVVEFEPMMAAEPAVAHTVTPFDTVIGYLHSSHLNIDTKRAVYRQLQTEVADENLSYLKRRLRYIEGLEKGWDGEDGLPVRKETLGMVNQLLRVLRPQELEDWALSPNVNGTILMEQDDAAISIASKEFSYYAERDDECIDAEHQLVSVEALADTVRKINHFMQG